MSYNFIIGPTDTDSLSFCKPDMSPLSKDEIKSLSKELNELSPEFMIWEDDGYYPKCLVLKAKNYILQDESGKVTYKGSSIKDQKKEKALQAFMKEIIESLMNEESISSQIEIYNKYVVSCFGLDSQGITNWTKKITVTEAVLNPERANEQKVLDAIGDRLVQEGDKIHVFYRRDKSLCLLEDFNGDYDEMKLVERLYDTLDIFTNVLDISQFTKYTLKKHKSQLETLLNEKSNKSTAVPSGSEGIEGDTSNASGSIGNAKKSRKVVSLQGHGDGFGDLGRSKHISTSTLKTTETNFRTEG
jgi:hypothetical protein